MIKEATPWVNVIIASGHVSPEIKAEQAKGELGGIIYKPYVPENVLATVSKISKTKALLERDCC